jgi:NAD-dependent deacetylase
MSADALAAAVEILAAARRLVVSTGAGMSRESGIPTFRDAQVGLWARFNPEELATEQGFRSAPARVWGWYASRRRTIAACAPHAGHHALAELERLLPEVAVVTQNIDGLHRAAGSSEVIELHGNIHRLRCLDRGHPFDGTLPEETREEDEWEEDPPPCPQCGSPLRPDVVWFGELLPAAATDRAWRLARECDVMLVVGTSGMVWPAAELPFLAAQAGARIVEINPDRSEISRVADVVVGGTAGEVLPALVRGVEASRADGA